MEKSSSHTGRCRGSEEGWLSAGVYVSARGFQKDISIVHGELCSSSAWVTYRRGRYQQVLIICLQHMVATGGENKSGVEVG